MALDRQIVGIDFTGGLETRTDERLVVPGKLLTCQNMTLSVTNTLTRKDGWEILLSSTNANCLAHSGDELLVVSGHTLYSMSGTGLGGSLTARGPVSPLTIAKDSVLRATGDRKTQIDCYASDTKICYVWVEMSAYYPAAEVTTGVYCMVFDANSGSVLKAKTAVAVSTTVYCPRVTRAKTASGASDTDSFIIGYCDVGTGGIKFRPMDYTTLALGGEVALVAGAQSGGMFDMIEDDSGGNALIVYTLSTNAVMVAHIKNVGGTLSAVHAMEVLSASSAGGGTTALAIVLFDTYLGRPVYTVLATIAAGSSGAGTWQSSVYTTATSITSRRAASYITLFGINGAIGLTATRITVASTYYLSVFVRTGTGADWLFYKARIDPDGVVSAVAIIFQSNNTRGPYFAGKAFTHPVDGVDCAYLPVYWEDETESLQQTLFILSESGAIHGKAMYGTYGHLTTYVTGTPALTSVVVSPDALEAWLPAEEYGKLSFDDGVITTPVGISRVRVGWVGQAPQSRATVGDTVFFSGGILSSYDGAVATEAGFHLFPNKPGSNITQGTAGVVDAGTHLYTALFEWVDAKGKRHQSAPATITTCTSAVSDGSHKVLVTYGTLRMTSKTGVKIVFFRTVVGGTTFYRLPTPLDEHVVNASVQYTDNTLDSALIANEVLYTTGGTLDNNGPPACTTIAAHQKRLWIGGLENAHEVRFSQSHVDGFGLQWNETLSTTVDGEQVTSLLPMDDKQVIFTSTGVNVISGTGPGASGQGNNFTDPSPVVSDAGCNYPRSVLATPNGLMFKSTKGWYLLGRGLNVNYIGAPVESFNSNGVTAAVMMADRKECRFYGPSSTLVYCYATDQWCSFSNSVAADALWWPKSSRVIVTTGTSASRVNRETPGYYTENNSVIVATIDTGWIRVSQALHGFQRAYQLLLEGPYWGYGSLVVTAYYDFNSSSSQSITISDTSVLATSGGNAWALRWKLPIQKCQAVRFRLVETPSASSAGGRGLGFSGMSLDVGIKRGAMKLPAAQSR